MEENVQKSNDRKYIIIILILIGIIIFLSINLYLSKQEVKTIIIEKTKVDNEKFSIKSELDVLMIEHKKLNEDYGIINEDLKMKDSIIQNKAKEIEKLLNENHDLRRVKRKLEYLRSIVQGYLTQIDSLQTVNKELVHENKKISSEYSKEKIKTQELSKDKDVLAGKVNIASVLKAYKITLSAVRLRYGGKKEEATEKAKRADKLKVCFTLSENNIIPAGAKTIYIRVAGPDNLVFAESNDDTHSFINQGATLQYSIKKDINYQNKEMDICAYWDKQMDYNPGKYNVTIFADANEIGSAQIILK
ncbi:MAG: hypothetical protein A2X12_03520 [Bacteroidetes bacterium GWE2_29_8]|nr:MAG: hypothetical protein A2X12_03520 [Bacteroidetes bacterium GWE2_29_8]OFY16436.1 MAG: hypothetical protein A2X02_02735 [Bacteroidetes bacterium GWF2_29_10]